MANPASSSLRLLHSSSSASRMVSPCCFLMTFTSASDKGLPSALIREQLPSSSAVNLTVMICVEAARLLGLMTVATGEQALADTQPRARQPSIGKQSSCARRNACSAWSCGDADTVFADVQTQSGCDLDPALKSKCHLKPPCFPGSERHR